MNIMDEMEFVDYVPDVDDGDGEIAQYENRTFKSDARIFHKNAWKTNVKRDKSIVTLSTLVKEFNAAFGNDDGRTRIKKEYLAAQQSYINGIEEDESVRVYPKASSQATMLPCIQSNFFRFFQLFQKYNFDQKHREKSWQRERKAMQREMSIMRKAIWIYRKKNGGKELSNAYLTRADDALKFYIESSDEDEEEVEKPPAKKQKVAAKQQFDGSGDGGSSSSSRSNEVDLVKKKKSNSDLLGKSVACGDLEIGWSKGTVIKKKKDKYEVEWEECPNSVYNRAKIKKLMKFYKDHFYFPIHQSILL